MNLKITVLAASAMVFATVSSQAANVLSFNFDTANSDYKYGYTYSELGSGTHDNGVFSPTGGVGGTGGLVVTFNTTSMSGGWAGFGAGFGDSRPEVNYEVLANLQSLADLTLSLDARAGGLSGASAGVTFELKFEAPDNTLGNDDNTQADALLRITSTRTLTSEFQNFTSSLNTWTVAEGSLGLLNTHFGVFNNINFNVAYDANGTLPAFGNDAGNLIAFDNYLITVVPEPSTLTLFGLGGIALLLRRRR